MWASEKGLEETVRELGGIKLTQPVGSTYQYCNINFMVAGLIVEVVSGQSYAEYMTEHIFEPLDMRHSHAALESARADGLAQGHLFMFGALFSNEGPIPPSNFPSGFLISSAEDMAHHAIAQMNAGRYGENSILSPEGMAELHAPAIPTGEDTSYAMGWGVGAWKGTPTISHTGDDGRNHSGIFLSPEQDMGFVLLANGTGFTQSSQVDQIARGIWFLLHGMPAEPVSAPFLAIFLYWLTLLTPVLKVLGIWLVFRRRERIAIWSLVLTVVLNIGLVLLLFQLALQRITLPSMLVYYPEVGYALVSVASIGVGWSAVLLADYLLKRRRVRSLHPTTS